MCGVTTCGLVVCVGEFGRAPQAVGADAALAAESHRAAGLGAALEAGVATVDLRAATDDRDFNRRVAAAADAANVPVNVVDDPAPSSFITPSLVERAPLWVAISSGGAAPVLARRLRERIEALLPSGYGRLAAFMERELQSPI